MVLTLYIDFMILPEKRMPDLSDQNFKSIIKCLYENDVSENRRLTFYGVVTGLTQTEQAEFKKQACP